MHVKDAFGRTDTQIPHGWDLADVAKTGYIEAC
jgi:hypothetical protein